MKDADVVNGSTTSGARTVIFSSTLTTALVNGNSITVSLPASGLARAVRANEFSGLAASPLDKTSAGGTGSTTRPMTSNATAAISQASELVIGSFAVEDKSNPITKDAKYTALVGANTGTSGSGASNSTA